MYEVALSKYLEALDKAGHIGLVVSTSNYPAEPARWNDSRSRLDVQPTDPTYIRATGDRLSE